MEAVVKPVRVYKTLTSGCRAIDSRGGLFKEISSEVDFAAEKAGLPSYNRTMQPRLFGPPLQHPRS